MATPRRNLAPESQVVWRSIVGGLPSYCFAGFVVREDADLVVIHQPTGAPTLRRTGTRGGPCNVMLPGGWDGGYEERPWRGAPSVRAHERGKPFVVIRGWDPERQEFVGWYVNLELPWAVTGVGFDSGAALLK